VEIVLGVSMAPTTVRMVLIEGQDADGVTVEQDTFGVAAGEHPATSGAADQVIGAIVGTREGAAEGGYRLASTGVTWTDPAGVGELRDALARCDVGGVMLVSPLLAAAALAQTVGNAIGYEHIAMVFVEPDSATLAVVEVADGSVVELHRRPLTGAGTPGREGAVAAELAAMVAGLDAPDARADGVFIVGCGVDIVGIKTALEAATTLVVSAPEEPDMALARGAALASANAPLFASSTAALAYALDPGTGELNPGALGPTYLDVDGNADLGAAALAYSAYSAYSAVDDVADHPPAQRRRPMFLAGSALAAIGAAVAGVVLVSLASDRPTSALQHNPRVSVGTPAKQMPAQAPSTPPQAQLPAPSTPPQAQLPAPSSPPPAPAVAAPPPPAPEAAAPPAPPPVVKQAPHPAVNTPAPPRRVPTQPAPEATPTPVPQAPAPAPSAPAPQPAAPAPQPAVAPSPPQYPQNPQYSQYPQYEPPTQPPPTMYLHLPFVTVPIPLKPPAPPAPPQ
jgi:hypothetical protein